MFSLAQLSTSELHWKQPNLFKMEYELSQKDELLARLHFPSGFKTLANATCHDGNWAFERVGILNQKVFVSLPGSETPMATLNYTANRIELPNGQHFLAKVNFWRTEYAFSVRSDQLLLKITSKGVINPALDIEINPVVACELPPPSPLPWLLLLGWYLVIVAHNDAAAAAV